MEAIEIQAVVDDFIVCDLVSRGWSVVPDFFDRALIASLLEEVLALDQEDRLSRAGIGRGGDFTIDESVRRDRIHWLAFDTPAQRAYRERIESLRMLLNRTLFLGLFEYECHFALYEAGAFYRRHLDSFRGAANRVVTTVTYLNPDWRDDDGGFLRIFDGQSDALQARVKPEAGTLVVFLSEETPHEVEISRRARASIAGWFRVNNTLGGTVDPLV